MYQISNKIIWKGEEDMKSKDLDLMTIKEVCDRLQISRNMAYSLLKKGDIEGVKVGRMWRIPDRSIWSYIMLNNKRKECFYHGQEEVQESK